MRKILTTICFVGMLLMTTGVFAQNKPQSQGQDLQQCFEQQGTWKSVKAVYPDRKVSKITLEMMLKVKHFPLGRFCGEYLPIDQLDFVKTWVSVLTSNVDNCVNQVLDPASVNFVISSFGGGYSDAIDFLNGLVLEQCRLPKLDSMSYLLASSSDDHVRLGLLRTSTVFYSAEKKISDFLAKNTGKYFSSANVVWKRLLYKQNPQDIYHTDVIGEFRYAEINFFVEVTLVEKEKQEVVIVPGPLPKIILQPEVVNLVVVPEKKEENRCKFGVDFIPGIGMMSPSPLIGLARNIFGISAMAGFDILLNNSCWGNWEFGPSLVAVSGINRVPYNGDRWQTLYGYGAGLKAKRKTVIFGKQGYVGGEARWLYLARNLDNSVAQSGDNVFVGPILGLFDFELRLGYLGMLINQVHSPNLYGELVYTF